MENTTKRRLSNLPNKDRKEYKISHEELKRIKKIKVRIASICLAAGMLVNPTIEGLAQNIGNNRNTKDAIRIAASFENYKREMKNNPIMQALVSVEEEIEIEELEAAIEDYKRLEYKKNRTFEEEERYLEASKIISSSSDIVVEFYTDAIRSEVAKTEEITNKKEIQDIEIKDYIHISQATGPEHTRVIEVPREGKLKITGNELKKRITEAREGLDDEKFQTHSKLDKKIIKSIIRRWKEALEFIENYKIVENKRGKLKAVKEVDNSREEVDNSREEVDNSREEVDNQIEAERER